MPRLEDQLLIKNAQITDPVGQHIFEGDILIKDRKIVEIGRNITNSKSRVLDANGLHVAPAFCDAHVHLRDPGYTYKEDIISGCASASAGGFTAVACMPNTNPVADAPEVISYILEKAAQAKARVYPVAAVTLGQKSRQLTDFASLKAAGAVALSDDGRPVASSELMRDALILAHKYGLPIISHCEDLDIIDGGIINEGEVSRKLGVKGMSRASEDSITAREIALARETGTAVHIAHVSTQGATQLIRSAKKSGTRVTAETCPHYFWFDDRMLLGRDADYRMNPPLRTAADCNSILEGIADGTFDMLVTDHAPHSPDEKADFLTAPNGIVGLETSFAASYTRLVLGGVIPLTRLIYMMSTAPRRFLGIAGGDIAVGSLADLVMFDTNQSFIVDPQQFFSKGRNSAFKGITLTGRVKATILGGEIVYFDT